MNIDLFLTHHGEAGLIGDRPSENKPSGVILDAETNFMTLEFADGQTIHLNIPIEEHYAEQLLMVPRMQVGMMEDGQVREHANVPLYYLNDPYGSSFAETAFRGKPDHTLVGFQQFMKRCTFAQAIHREDVGNEDSVGSVLRGSSPQNLQFAPQLVRDKSLDVNIGPRTPGLSYGISHAPGPKGPGGMGGSSTRSTPRRTPPPRHTSDDDN